MITTHQKDYARQPEAARTMIQHNLQASHFVLGDQKGGAMITSNQETFGPRDFINVQVEKPREDLK